MADVDLLALYSGEEAAQGEILDRRERRALRQKELLEKFAGGCLVSFTLNIPGPVKRFPLCERAFGEGLRQIRRQLALRHIAVSHAEEIREKTGCEAMLLAAGDPKEIKILMSGIETAHGLGRLFDIDVLSPDGRKTGRQDICLPLRTCFICGGPAHVCSRSRAHGLEELRRAAAGILWNYFTQDFEDAVVSCAHKALLHELAVSPKPGLVDRRNCGAHGDMDFFTFLDSIAALVPWLRKFIHAGLVSADLPASGMLAELRFIGRQAEEAMFAATGNINTHKGIIFSLGLVCAGAGMLYGLKKDYSLTGLAALCADLARNTLADFEGITPENCGTHGEKLYALYGIQGIRGEAAAGFPSVLRYGLPVLREGFSCGLCLNDAAAVCLVNLIAHVDDTNLITRGGMETQKQIQREAEELVRLMLREKRIDFLYDMDRRFIEKNLSPGGCADLLALTLFFYFLEEAMSHAGN
jgi:holo-ACP synthase/triphosphoribosyl-dephospho-CoA synthase